MDSYQFLLDFAIILLSTKVLGLVTKKIPDAPGCRCIAGRSSIGTSGAWIN